MREAIAYTFGDDYTKVDARTTQRRWTDLEVGRWLTTSQAWKFRGNGFEGDALVVLSEGSYGRPSNYVVLRIGNDVSVMEDVSFRKALEAHNIATIDTRGGFELSPNCAGFKHPGVAKAMKRVVRKAVASGEAQTLKKTEKRVATLLSLSSKADAGPDRTFVFEGVTLEGSWKIILK